MHLSGVRMSVRSLSVPAWATAANFVAVALPAADIDRLQRRRMRAVPRCQRTLIIA